MILTPDPRRCRAYILSLEPQDEPHRRLIEREFFCAIPRREVEGDHFIIRDERGNRNLKRTERFIKGFQAVNNVTTLKSESLKLSLQQGGRVTS